MMKLNLIIVFASLALGAFASPKFVTPAMTYRNGLTDEQYEMLWKQGRHPKIDVATARDWIFRASRYQNVTNWLEVIGKTNDFARLVVPTMATNEVLKVENKNLVNAVGKLEKDLEAAETDAEVTRAIQKAAERSEKNLEKVLKALEKARDKSQTEDEAAVYSALIAALTGQQPNQKF